MRSFKTLLFLTTLVFAIALSYASAVPGPQNDPLDARSFTPTPLDRRDDEPTRLLEKRACVTQGCTCKKGTAQGRYCYMCDAVLTCGSEVGGASCMDSVFECNPDGGCCNYGLRNSCKGGKKDPCGP